MTMTFTIGYSYSYEKGFERAEKNGIPLMKVGTREDYDGGCVWKTEEEARKYLKENWPRLDGYNVYGVLADWERDTAKLEGEPFSRLLVDSELVKLEDESGS